MPFLSDLPVIDDEEEQRGLDLARLFGVPRPPPFVEAPPDLAAPEEIGADPLADLFASPTAPAYRARMRRLKPKPNPPDDHVSFDTRTKTWTGALADTPPLPHAPMPDPRMREVDVVTGKPWQDAPQAQTMGVAGVPLPAPPPSMQVDPAKIARQAKQNFKDLLAAGGPMVRNNPELGGALTEPPPTLDDLRKFNEATSKPVIPLSAGAQPGTLMHGVLAGAEGITTPENLALLAGMGVTGGAIAAAEANLRGYPLVALRGLSMGLHGVFTGQMIQEATHEGKAAYDAFLKGDMQAVAEHAGVGSVSALYAILGTKHGIDQLKGIWTTKVPKPSWMNDDNGPGGPGGPYQREPKPVTARQAELPGGSADDNGPGGPGGPGGPPAEPPKPSDVERVSPDTPNPPTAATPTTPEAQETQVIQLQQLTDGTRKVVMFPKGSTPPSYPVGVSVTHDAFGNIYVYRPDLIKASDIHTAAKNNTLPGILGSSQVGMGAPDKSAIPPGQPTHTVVARDGNGTEVQATATPAEDLPATIEATHHVTPPGGSVSVEPVGQVLGEREGAPPAEPTKPTELGAPADLERPAEDTTGLTQLGGDMGQGIVGGMREMLWQKVQAGDVTEGGQPSAVLQAAKMVRDSGGLQTPEELHNFLHDYGNIKRDGQFQQSMRDLVQKYAQEGQQHSARQQAFEERKQQGKTASQLYTRPDGIQIFSIEHAPGEHVTVAALPGYTKGGAGGWAGTQLKDELAARGLSNENVVGIGDFTPDSDHEDSQLYPQGTSVKDDFRRRGVASDIYHHTEVATGKKIKASGVQSPEGEALSKGRKSDYWKPKPARSYEQVQRDIDEMEDQMEREGVNVSRLYEPTDYNEKVFEGSSEWKPRPHALSKLYDEREAVQEQEDQGLDTGVDQRLKALVPDDAQRAALVKEITETGKPFAIRHTESGESIANLGRIANVIVKHVAENVTNEDADRWEQVKARLAGDAQNPSIQLVREAGPNGYFPFSEKTYQEAQKILDALMEGNAPKYPPRPLETYKSEEPEPKELEAPAEIGAQTQEVEKTEPELHKRIFEELSKPWRSIRRAEAYLEDLNQDHEDYYEERSRVEVAIEREQGHFNEILDQARNRVGHEVASEIEDKVKFQPVDLDDDFPRLDSTPAQFKTWRDFRKSVKVGDIVYADLGGARKPSGKITEILDWDRAVEVKVDRDSMPGHSPIGPILDQLHETDLFKGAHVTANWPWEILSTKAPTIIDIKADDDMGTPAQIEAPEEKPAETAPVENGELKPSPIKFSDEAAKLLEALPEKYQDPLDVTGPGNLGILSRGLRSAKDGVLATASNDRYRVTIAPFPPGGGHAGALVLEDLQKPGFPVSSGAWMDFYEPYMKQYGVPNEKAYNKLSRAERAQVEVQRQVDKYETAEKSLYPEWFARSYYPAEWEQWMDAHRNQNTGARPMWTKTSIEHWRQRFSLGQAAEDMGAPAPIEQPIEQPAPENPSEKPPEKPAEQLSSSEQPSEELATPQALEPGGAAALVNAVYEKLRRGESLGNVTELTRMAEQHFGSGRTDGEWSVKDMFDAMEAGINKYLVHIGKDLMELPFDEGIQVVRNLMARITSQGTRTDEQVKRQQFSTPPSQSYLAVKVANVKPSDIVLEPSAGTGDLVALPKAIGATVYVNEIAPRRIEMLEAAGFGKATDHDGEIIHSRLDPKIKPTVIVMNPPFSTSTRQGDARNRNIYGFNHVTSALQRLEPGGRLVVILGGGQANEPNGGASLFGGQSGKWFEKVARNYAIRANVRISGREYQKYGTTFATRLIVIDKTGPTTDMSTVVQGNVDTLEQAYELLRPIAESRPELQARPGSPASTGQPGNTRGGLATGSGGVSKGGGRTTAGGASSNAQDDTGSEPVRPDGDTAGNAPRPGGQPPTRVEPDSGPTSAGAGESPQGAASVTSDDDDERPVQPPEVTERQQLESVERGEEPDQEDTQAYVTYRPTLKGAPHPGEIVETKAMATVPMPKITYKPALPKDVIEKKVSAVQLEGISLAGQQNEIILPSGARSSVLIGDGTGVGKGREAAGILLDNWLQGRKRLVWVSKSWNLTQDALRDFDGLGATDLMRGITKENGRYIVDKKGGQPRFVQQGDFDASENIKGHKGLVFTTYTLLPTGDKKHNTRLAQLENYLRGDDDGEGAFILFDESHLLKNAVTAGRGTASQVGMGVRQILERIPKLRTASLSATAATDVTNLGYLGRLGLWGAGTAFPSGFEQFQNEMAEGGIAAMELVARELKAEGKYLSRTLSFKGVTYETATHKLNPDQRALYKTATQAWDVALKAAMKTIEDTTNGGSRARSGFLSQLGGAQQRFFSVLLTTLKIPTAVEIAKQAERDGFAVAISLVNTNEASQNREKAKLAKRPASEDEDEQELDFGPKEILTNLIRQHYPIHQYADGVDPDGRPIKVLVMRPNPADPTGPEIAEVNPQAEAERDALLALIDRDLHLPENPLDSLIKALGGRNKVAELTGRTEIYDRDKRTFVPRGDKGVPKDQINIIEMAKFQAGEKQFAVLSSAADTGISLHASNQAKNQRRRMMITLQVGWSADKAQQMLGRVHRTDQASAPHYVLLVSDMGGEMRFISTIARRIASLGALTKGQKDATGGNDLMAQVDFQGEQGIQATVAFYEALLKNQEVPGTGLRGRDILSKLRVLRDGMTVSGPDRTNVNKLLNNLLALEPDIQNQVYKYYFEIFQAAIQEALDNNTLDTGVRSLPGDEFFFKDGRTIATNPKTGATTHYQPITVRSRIPRLSLSQREQRMRANQASNPRVVVRSDGKKMALLTDAYPIVHADGSSSPSVYAARPERSNSNRQDAAEYDKWRTPQDFAQQKQAMLETKVKEFEGALERREKMLADTEAGEKTRRRRPIAARIQSLESRIQSLDGDIAAATSDEDREYYAAPRAQAGKDLAQAQKDLAEVENYKHEDAWLTRDIESIRKNLDTAKAALEPWKELFEDPEKWGDELWTQLHDDAPAHEDIEHHFITGAVFSYWNAIRQAAHVRTSIFTASDSHTGRRIVGIEIPDGQIRGLLGRIEGGGSTVDATQMIIDVLRSGLQYQLEGGIEVVRYRVARENVIQLVTSNPDVARRLTALGAVYERGVMPVYYIPNRNTHAILSRILEEFPIRTGTPPPQNGGNDNSVTLGSGLGALQALPQYLAPQLKAASRFFSRVTDDAKRVFAPQTRGDEARQSAGNVREMMGTLAQKEAQVHAALEDYRKVFRQMPEEHGIHGLSVIDAIEDGPQAIAALPPEVQGFATTVRALYEDRKQMLDGLGLVKHFLENYFTHMYKNPAEAESWTANWLSKRPLAGKEEFRKQRVYPTIREALEDPDFTLVAKFDNPVDYVYAGLAQMDKSIAAHDLFNEWNDAGYLKYSLKRPAGGYSQIDDKLFTVRGPRRGAVKIDPLEPQQRPNEDVDDFEVRYHAWEDKMDAIEGGYIKPGDVRVYGQRTMGHYWAPDQVAQVANNYLSPSLQGKAFFDAWMKVKGHMNAINLGFSGFHALTTTLNSSLSDMALGTQQVLSGKPVKGLVSIGKGFVPFQSIAQDYVRGTRLGKVWDGTAANPTAQELAIVDALRQAGGRYQQSNDVAPLLKGLKQAWAQNKASGIIRGFNPWLWAEQSMRPIMEKLVPAAKFGAFAKLAQFEIERDPGMDPNEARRRFGSILDSIDNRMGQLSQRNMLMDNAVRSWMNAIVGRPGWTLGTIREIVGGTGDLASNLYDLSRGKSTQLSHRSAYLLALLLGGAIMNGLLTVLLTGHPPKGADFIAPRDGGMTEDGHESRIIIPLYLSKDVYSWATHPLRTLKAKMAQPLMVTSDLATNRDFQNHKIYGQGGIGLDTYLMQIFFPYVLTGALKNIERGQGWKTALPFVGIMPGSRDVGLSKAEKILQAYREEQMANVRPAATAHSRARSKMMMAAERGDVDTVRELGMAGLENQTLSKRDVDAAMQRINTPLIVSEIKAVTDMETLMNAYDAATPEERDMIDDTVRSKVARGRLEPYKWSPRARKLAEKYFSIEIPRAGGPADDLGTPASLDSTA